MAKRALPAGSAVASARDFAAHSLNRLLPIVFAAVLMLACASGGNRRTFISTVFYGLEANYHEGMLPEPSASGGGIAQIADHFLLVTGEGNFYLFDWSQEPGERVFQALPYRAPINRQEFVAHHGVNWESFRFRVSDVLLQQRGELLEIFVTHHFWKASESCYVMRVSTREARTDEFFAGTSQGSWKTLHETSPCLPLREGGRGHPFGGQQQGGRMAWLDSDSLLLTVGDHEFDGWNGKRVFSQDPAVSYGKILQIDRRSGASRVFSLGHRNPQGLYIDPKGAIWSTEHGPSGGDELNRIATGANYGWPHVTYGTEYGAYVWPPNEQQGRHDGYVLPVYSWLPSIGVSNLVGVQKDIFPAWKGDLLVASLVGETLHRVRIRQGRVLFAEPIAIGKRIRDIIEATDGTILLWTDDASLVSLRPGVASGNGELLFASRCGGCHPVLDGQSHGIGPDLHGVAGKRIAAAESFSYSEAIMSLGGRWSETRLDAFLRDPAAFAPGTAMRTEGIGDPASRAAIVEHLRSLR